MNDSELTARLSDSSNSDPANSHMPEFRGGQDVPSVRNTGDQVVSPLVGYPAPSTESLASIDPLVGESAGFLEEHGLNWEFVNIYKLSILNYDPSGSNIGDQLAEAAKVVRCIQGHERLMHTRWLSARMRLDTLLELFVTSCPINDEKVGPLMSRVYDSKGAAAIHYRNTLLWMIDTELEKMNPTKADTFHLLLIFVHRLKMLDDSEERMILSIYLATHIAKNWGVYEATRGQKTLQRFWHQVPWLTKELVRIMPHIRDGRLWK